MQHRNFHNYYMNLIRAEVWGGEEVTIWNNGLTDGVCETAPAPIRSVEGQLRLVTPTVVSQTQEHFGCYTEADFGGPLEMNVSHSWNGCLSGRWEMGWIFVVIYPTACLTKECTFDLQRSVQLLQKHDCWDWVYCIFLHKIGRGKGAVQFSLPGALDAMMIMTLLNLSLLLLWPC